MVAWYVGIIVILMILTIYFYREAYATRVYWFHRPGCPACEAMEDEWALFEKGTYFGMIKAIDIDTSKSKNDAISVDFGFKTVPHIVKVNGDMRLVYEGERTASAINNWLSK